MYPGSAKLAVFGSLGLLGDVAICWQVHAEKIAHDEQQAVLNLPLRNATGHVPRPLIVSQVQKAPFGRRGIIRVLSLMAGGSGKSCEMLGGLGLTKTRSRAVSYSHHLYVGGRACISRIVSQCEPFDGCSCSRRKDAAHAALATPAGMM